MLEDWEAELVASVLLKDLVAPTKPGAGLSTRNGRDWMARRRSARWVSLLAAAERQHL